MSSLENQVTLGLHLGAGASDGYITSAEFIKDETKSQTVQETLDNIVTSEGSTSAALTEHIKDTSNPHNVTKAQIGLGNVDNTSDADKPISTATLSALDNKVDKVTGKSLVDDDEITKLAGLSDQATIDASIKSAVSTHENRTDNPHQVTKSQVGLSNVTNDAQVKRSEMGVANGVATLDESGLVPSSQLPSYVDDVLEYTSKSSFPTTGETGKIYVATDTNLTYRWSGTAYVEISQSLALGETSSTAYAGDKGKANADAIAAEVTRAKAAEESLEEKINAINEVEIGEGSPTDTSVELFVDTSEDVGADFYTKEQIDTMITTITIAEVEELWES